MALFLLTVKGVKSLLLFTSIFSVFIITALLVKSGAPTICTDSMLVKKVIIFDSQNNTESIRRCDEDFVSSPISADRQILAGEIVRRLSKLNYLSQWLNKQNIQLAIDEAHHFRAEIRSGALILGDLTARAEGILEKAVLLAALKSEAEHLSQDQLILELVADLLWAIANGDLSEQDPFSGEVFLASSSPINSWMTMALNLKDYCHSPRKSLFHYSYCELQNGRVIEGATSRSFTVLSLRPLLSHFLWAYYQNLSLLDKGQFVSGLLDSTNKKWSSVVGLAVFDESDWEGVESWIQSFLKSFIEASMRKIQTAPFDTLIKQISVGTHPVLDLLIAVRGKKADWSQFTNLHDISRRPIVKKAALVMNDKWYFLPNTMAFPLKGKKPFRARQVVIADCGQGMTASELVKLKPITSKVAYVRTCPGDQSIDWHWLIRYGFNSLVRHNRHVSFVSFDLRALTVAEKWKELPIDNITDPSKLSRWLGWQSVNWDNHQVAYRPAAVIDGVEYFR